jgi:hypothetical protein
MPDAGDLVLDTGNLVPGPRDRVPLSTRSEQRLRRLFT